jgi:D-sedoheptulose 7-phosphate isomerase
VPSMKSVIEDALEEHARVAQRLREGFAGPIEDAARRVISCYRAGGKVLIMGNGGSAADAQHFAAELVGRYRRERRALPALALSTDSSILTAVSNDYAFADVFRRQVEAHAQKGDVVFGLSTSGNSENVCRAMELAGQRGAVRIVLAGGSGGRLRELADLALIVPSSETPRIQEAHIAIIHIVCDLVEAELAAESA